MYQNIQIKDMSSYLLFIPKLLKLENKYLVFTNKFNIEPSDFLFLRKLKEQVFVFETKVTLYVILKYLESFDRVIILDGKFSAFENEFLNQLCNLNDICIYNFRQSM